MVGRESGRGGAAAELTGIRAAYDRAAAAWAAGPPCAATFW